MSLYDSEWGLGGFFEYIYKGTIREYDEAILLRIGSWGVFRVYFYRNHKGILRIGSVTEYCEPLARVSFYRSQKGILGAYIWSIFTKGTIRED